MSKNKEYSKCLVADCTADAKIKGYCPRHYASYTRYGLEGMLEDHKHLHEDYTKYEGQKFGKWTVLKFVKRVGTSVIMDCKCECGTLSRVLLNNLKGGRSKRCRYCKGNPAVKHGLSRHPSYHLWHNIMDKCYYKNSVVYQYFGAKGITVCKAWHRSEQFVKDVPERIPGKRLVLKPGAKVFSPNTVEWLTNEELLRRKWLTGVLNAALLAKRTGYSRERIRQMSTLVENGNKQPVLQKYILYKKVVNTNIIIHYKPSAIPFLLARKNKLRQD